MAAQRDARGLTRGGLLKAGAIAAFAVGAGAGGRALVSDQRADTAAASGIGNLSDSPPYLRHATYAPLVGSDFKLRLEPGRTVRLRLVEARKVPGGAAAFSLLFRAPDRAVIDGAVYPFEHPEIGRFDLFVSPVERAVQSQHLEAVVNRLAT